jgi:hypothetical protein
MTNTPNLVMPYIVAGQAQKEVTHNDALNDMDSLAQISVISRSVATPPTSPAEGDCYVIAPSPTGAWAGNANAIASYYSGWRIKQPKAGWNAYVQDESTPYFYDGTAWSAAVVGQSISLSGNISAPSWASAGVAFKAASATYTNTTSSGTVATQGVYAFGIPTLAATSATTYTNSGSVIIRGAPISGSNVTQTSANALLVESGSIKVLSGNITVSAGSISTNAFSTTGGNLTVGMTFSQASWTTNGIFRLASGTITNSTGTGTVATQVAASIGTINFASSSAMTVTDAASFYIAAAPGAGTNTTITRGWSHYVAAGHAYFGGSVVVAATPSAPNANALLDIQSTTKAFMPPRMTTTQKNAIPSPTSGMVVYDSTLNKLCVYGAAAWETITSV